MSSVFQCDSYEFAKHCRTSYPMRINKSTSLFEIVHSDVWGSAPIVSLFGFRYFVTSVDDFSRCTWLYLLKSKSYVFPMFHSIR